MVFNRIKWNKATKTVSKIRQEMIFHEKRSLSEISRLTGIVDAMGNDPDIMRATMGGGVSPSLSTGVQTGAPTQVTAVARMGLGGDFVGRREELAGFCEVSGKDLGNHPAGQ